MENRRCFLKKSAIMAAGTIFPVLPSCIPLNTIEAKVPLKSNKIKNAAVLWYSQTGNTQKCGKVLAKTLEKKGIKVIYGDLRDIDKSIISNVDLIVIGSPVFYYDTPEFVKDFIESLPELNGIPVAAYVTFGGPEGNQYNAACSILEGLVQKKGVPVGLESFMSISSYSLSFKENDINITTKQNTILPDQNTYKKVREYAEFIKSQIEKGSSSVFKRTLTLREFSTYFEPEWWTKLAVDNHYIIEQKCVGCGTCVEKCPTNSIDLDSFSVNTKTCILCFGCINNCQYQAMNMESNNKKLISFHEYMKKNNLKFVLPNELKD
ncbi:MAG: 4Fe-4S binding protein [Deltaproteobacteria bacterium]|uniref:EFR1 family ferrodoxin n=1 Tax=Desulfobacula sp. TaxID=2593537 RepID=UPI00198DE95C|nr:4Fe-4S binding protein [Candidatus Desulfobacula maris]MBL6993642.1 EFR1 family ferrodoxin [Desulfobacula sp.]